MNTKIISIALALFMICPSFTMLSGMVKSYGQVKESEIMGVEPLSDVNVVPGTPLEDVYQVLPDKVMVRTAKDDAPISVLPSLRL